MANNNLNQDIKRLTKEILNINGTFEAITRSTNIACQYINESKVIMIQERGFDAVSLCKEAIPPLVSLKQLGDSVLKNDLKGCNLQTEENLRKTLEKIEDNHRQKQEYFMSITESSRNLESFTEQLKKLHQKRFLRAKTTSPQEEQLGTTVQCFGPQEYGDLHLSTEISSFAVEDIVASSPLAKN